MQSRIANDIGGVQTRRHQHRDLDRLERDHGAGRDGRDVPARLAPRGGRARAAAVLRLAHPPRGRGAAPDHRRAPGPARRHVVAGRGVAVGLRASCSARRWAARRELAERFERESAALADLEVRSRMAGRWRMASVQISFAAMPALIYLFAGLTIAGGGAAITIGTLVAFTTLQTRLFFPVQSLLSVGVDVQSSLALFERVFDYLDLPVEIEERDGAVTLRPDRRDAERSRSRASDSGTRADGAVDAARRRPRGPARDDARARRRDRLGQDDARLPARAPVRRRGGPRDDRRHRRARPHPRLAGRGRRRRLAGDPPLPRLDRGQPALREAGRHRRRSSSRRRAPRRSTT